VPERPDALGIEQQRGLVIEEGVLLAIEGGADQAPVVYARANPGSRSMARV